MDTKVLILIGGILGIIGAIFTVYGAFKSAGEKNKYEQEIRAKTEEITKKNEEIANLITGGDSYCILTLQPDPWKNALIKITNKGKYPIYELKVTISNNEKSNFIKHLDIGTLPANQAWVWGAGREWNLYSMPFSYHIIFNSRNCNFYELYKKKEINGTTKEGIQVYKDNKEGKREIIYKMPPDFPEDKDGFI